MSKLRTARYYHCTWCHIQVCICTACDRGNVYCEACALGARQRSLQAAGKRHQATRKGKLKHAARQKIYRENQKIVTHHGSVEQTLCVLLPSVPLEQKILNDRAVTCDFCHEQCSSFSRINFLGGSLSTKRYLKFLALSP